MTNEANTKYYNIRDIPPGLYRLPASRVKRLQETGKTFDPRTGRIDKTGTKGHPFIYGEWEPVFTETGKYRGVATL